MLKLLVVDDHSLVRDGLVRLLAQIEDKVVVFEAPDFESALTVLDNEGDFDLLLLDLALPRIDGFTGLDILRRRYPAMPVVVVSAYDDTPNINRALNLGASGFVPKSFPADQLLQAVREVLAGNIFRPGRTSSRDKAVIDDAPPPPPGKLRVLPEEIGLTDRQAQVLALMVRGMSNREIADHLSLSEGTVKIHATAVFKTLEVTSRTQALVAVNRYGLVLDNVF